MSVFKIGQSQAQSIARKTLKSLCDAIGWTDVVKDASIFLHKPCRIRLKIEADKSGVYGDRNKVIGIGPLASPSSPTAAPIGHPSPPKSGNAGASEAPAKPAAAPRTQGAPRPGPTGTAPWHVTR
jgi:hypothetical protein